MNKILVEFIEKNDVEKLFVPSYRKVLSPSAVESFLIDFKFDEQNNASEVLLMNQIEALGISALKNNVSLDVHFAIRDILKPKHELQVGFSLMFPIEKEEYWGEGLFCGDLRDKAIQNSPLDNVLMKEWDAPTVINYLDHPVYPSIGMFFHPENPRTSELRDVFNVEPYSILTWFDLSVIYDYYFHGSDKHNLKQYYADLRSIGIYPNVPLLPYFVAKSMGALNDGVTFEDFHKASRPTYIEF